MLKAGKKVARAFSVLGAYLRVLGLSFVVSCAHAPSPSDRSATPLEGAGGGLTPASSALFDVTLANVSKPLTWANADRRYAQLGGATFTGEVNIANATNDALTIGTTNGTHTILHAETGSSALCLGGGNNDGTCTTAVRLRWNPNQLELANLTGGALLTMAGTASTFSGSLATGGALNARHAGATVFDFGSVGNSFLSMTSGAVLQQSVGYYRNLGATTAALPTCNAGAAGAFEWDTTRREYVRCAEDVTGFGSYSWENVAAPIATFSGYAASPGTAAEVTLQELRFYRRIRTLRLATNIVTAGVDASASNFTVTVFDVTAGVVLCQDDMACDTAAGTQSADCLTSLDAQSTAAQVSDVALRIDATACDTAPQGVTFTVAYR